MHLSVVSIISLISLSVIQALEKGKRASLSLGDEAPAFSAETTNGSIEFPKDYGYKWKILFSHPADFTPVCTSELLELAAIQEDFKKLDANLVVVSTDRLDTHKRWIKSMETLEYKGRKTPSIQFPLVDDNNKVIASRYGMIHPANNSTRDVRGVFIICHEN